jgi:5'-nucleotidase
MICLSIFTFGCSEDESTPYDRNIVQAGKTYVQGMAADGDPIKGAVFIQGMKKQASDAEEPEIEEVMALIENDGTFKCNVSNLEPPYLIQAKGIGKVDKAVEYYAIASSDTEWTNCTKYSDAAVRMSTNNDPEKAFSKTIEMPEDYATSKKQITDLVRELLQYHPDNPANASNIDPFTDRFVANPSDPFDSLLGMTKIAVTSDSITIASNKMSNAEVLYVADYKLTDNLSVLENHLTEQLFTALKNELTLSRIVNLTILQTSDLHNHASGYGPFLDYTPMDTTDNDGVTGGFARLASVIASHKASLGAKNIPLLLVDSGDFYMGTMYDLAATAPVPLVFFEALGYDAITLGNHEFDWTPTGLYSLLKNSVSHPDMPLTFSVPIVASNSIIPTDTFLNDFKTDDAIDNTPNLIRDKLVKELPNGLKVGILGWMGITADTYAPAAPPVTFNHDTDYLLNMMDALVEEDQCDLILILSHGGVDKEGKGDDADLAEAIGDHMNVDYTKRVIIASGHAHTATQQLIVKGADTYIFSPGAYGQYLSRFDIRFDMDKKQIVDNAFQLIDINDMIMGYKDIDDAIQQVNTELSNKLQDLLGTAVDTPVAVLKDFEIKFSESKAAPSGLGNLCTDATRAVANQLVALSADKNPYMFSVMANGNLRDTLKPGKTGKITFSDIFNVLPLGLSPIAGIYPEKTVPPGYPLYSVYFNAADIRKFCEMSVAVQLELHEKLSSEYYLHFSGVKYAYHYPTDPSEVGKLVDNVSFFYPSPSDPMCMTSTMIPLPSENGAPGSIWDNDSTQVYRAVVDLYLLQMFNQIKNNSDYEDYKNLLLYFDIMPEFRKANGEPLSLEPSVGGSEYLEFSNNYALDSSADPGTQEIYAWAALLKYIQAWSGFGFSFEDGLPVLPETVPYNENYISVFSRVTAPAAP